MTYGFWVSYEWTDCPYLSKHLDNVSMQYNTFFLDSKHGIFQVTMSDILLSYASKTFRYLLELPHWALAIYVLKVKYHGT